MWQDGLSHGLQGESSPVKYSDKPHQIACHFAHILPLKHVYQNNIYFVRVLLNASANGKMVVAGGSFLRIAGMKARQ